MKLLLLSLISLFGLGFDNLYEGSSLDDPPEIIIEDRIYHSDVDNPITVEYIQSLIQANDDVDGDITDQIYVIYDGFTGNEHVKGEYFIIYGVKDSIFQLTRVNVKIIVVDVYAPVINYIEDIDIDINHDPINFLNGVTVSDNYDGDITVFLSMDDSEVIYSEYGEYNVYYSVSDESGNLTEESILVRVRDLAMPEISGVTEIYKEVSDLLTIQEIKAWLNASDNLEGDIKSKLKIVEDNYTGHGNLPGEYTIKFSVTDNFENTFIHTVTVHVVTGIPQVLYKDKQFLQLGKDKEISNEQIESLLTTLGELDPYSDYSLRIIKDEYTPNKHVTGIYDYYVQFISSSGETVTKNLKIQVEQTEELQNFPGDERPPEPSWIEKNKVVLGLTGALILSGVGAFVVIRRL